jgi:hypothetical protein
VNLVKRHTGRRAVVVVLGAALALCPAGTTQARAEATRQIRLSAELQLPSPASSAIDSALAGSLPDEFEVRLEEGRGERRTIRTCTDFLAITDKPFDTDNERDWQLIWAQGLRCVALKWLKNAQPAKRSLIDDFHLDRRAAQRLPPQLALPVAREEVERAQKAAAACQSVKVLEPSTKTKVRSESKITFEGKGWEAEVIEYARGDFDGDGFEDLLLRRDGGLKGGSYRLTNIFILTRTSQDRGLRVVWEMP